MTKGLESLIIKTLLEEKPQFKNYTCEEIFRFRSWEKTVNNAIENIEQSWPDFDGQRVYDELGLS